MTPEEFVSALRTVVLAAAVDATVASLDRPPGRRPPKALTEASAWYHGLSEQDRAMLERVLTMTAHQAVFGFLAVLDGARVTEDEPEKALFRLLWRKGSVELELNPSDGIPLHDILNQQEPSDP